MQGRWWWWEARQNAEIDHLRLAFGREGGGGGGIRGEMLKRITFGSRLGAREVVVVANVLKRQKGPPPARV